MDGCQLNTDSSFLSRKLLMVEPTSFGSNPETLKDNSFMKTISEDSQNFSIQNESQKEFKSFVNNLKEKQVEVVTYLQPTEESKDAIFPNNWFSTHKNKNLPDGLLIIHPLLSPNRRLERTKEIISFLKKDYKHFIDLSYLENENEFLESTGSLIFDHSNFKIYCGISERATQRALNIFLEKFNQFTTSPYELITFNTLDGAGKPIYHTNVVMSVLEKHVVICLNAIKNEKERLKVLSSIQKSKNKKLIELSEKEMINFCGNVLTVKSCNTNKKTILIISKTAYDNLTFENKCELESEYELCINEISTIELIGGGSARCMVAEIFI